MRVERKVRTVDVFNRDYVPDIKPMDIPHDKIDMCACVPARAVTAPPGIKPVRTVTIYVACALDLDAYDSFSSVERVVVLRFSKWAQEQEPPLVGG